MKRVLTAVVLIPLVLLAVFRAPWWLLPVLLALVVMLALRESLNLIKGYDITPPGWAVYTASVLVILTMVLGTVFGDFLISGGWGLPMLLALGCALPVIFRKDMRGALLA